MDIITMKGL